MTEHRPVIIAHRGFSGVQPEMTVAAYREAIAWARRERRPLCLECDVHFSADDQLICLHDLLLDRTSADRGPAFGRTVAELEAIDFGSWRVRDPGPEQRRLVTLDGLFDLLAEGLNDGIELSLNVETKHPNPRGLEIEERLAEMLSGRGWNGADSPVKVITFDLSALERLGVLLPPLDRTLLIEDDLGQWIDGRLPDGVHIAGPDLRLIKADPGFVERAHAHGNAVHVWTVNDYADIEFCRELSIDGYTTDYPDRVAAVLG